VPPPTSVILPTTAPTPALDELAAQLRPPDELLVVCDDDSDPVADAVGDVDGARTVVAGDPTGCSGKANAIAAGMAAAAHDRVVWTDDDFPHPPTWLADLQADYERVGPVSELYFFVGADPLSVLLEPVYALGGTLGTYATDKAWGGAVLFERDDLDCDPAALRRDLRRTVSDDALLSERLDVTSLRRVRRVEVGGTIRETLERHVRFTQIVHRFDPRDTVSVGLVTSLLALCCLLVPGYATVAVTGLTAAVYAYFGVRRWTALLACPAIPLAVPLLAYALARRTFVWGGRRYRWRSKFDVEIVE
jgi:glycosyltransferase involved in cell wall biosynthesis